MPNNRVRQTRQSQRRLLRLQKELAAVEANKEDRRHDLARQVKRLDAQIDNLVYELYGLTEEEIKVVGEGEMLRRGSGEWTRQAS